MKLTANDSDVKSRRRARVVALLSSVITVALAGCVPFLDRLPGDGAISRSGDYLVFAVCTAVTADDVRFSRRNLDQANEWTRFWTFNNAGALKVGQLLSTDEQVTPPFPGEQRERVDLRPGTEISVRIAHDGELVVWRMWGDWK